MRDYLSNFYDQLGETQRLIIGIIGVLIAMIPTVVIIYWIVSDVLRWLGG